MPKIKLVIEFDDTITNRQTATLLKDMYENGDIDVLDFYVDGEQKPIPPREAAPEPIALEEDKSILPPSADSLDSESPLSSLVEDESKRIQIPIYPDAQEEPAPEGGNAQVQHRG